jgi:hypothetical protein
MKILRFVCLCLSLLADLTTSAQNDSAVQRERLFRKSSFIPIPIGYYTPETGWGGGAAAFYTFRLRGQTDGNRPSQVQIGLAYTQKKQLLAYLPFQYFSKNEAWQSYGELGYYRYVYPFFGIGNRTSPAEEEIFSANYPRLRFNLLRQIAHHQYFGLRYWWDDYNIVKTKPGGLFFTENFDGKNGGVVSGAGLIWNYDNRDSLFYPTHGWLVEAEVFFNRKMLGSDLNFSRFSIDAALYFSPTRRQVIALNGWVASLHGDPPFQQLALIGGTRKMRGFLEGRFRDRKLWMLQAEWRSKIWRRFGGVLFTGAGSVAPDFPNLLEEKIHLTAGGGLRFTLSKKDHINLRFDVATNQEKDLLYYLTVREAF